MVGGEVGAFDGDEVGDGDGAFVGGDVGSGVGAFVGSEVGDGVGAFVGNKVGGGVGTIGAGVGLSVGVGDFDGGEVGSGVGLAVGWSTRKCKKLDTRDTNQSERRGCFRFSLHPRICYYLLAPDYHTLPLQPSAKRCDRHCPFFGL